ncbi:MAG TPA: 30S ribosomal protein S12 methylthiotransferase RimO, partial [Erythrobacter sp.]|nr:30S ribosomal protein S12 methylthiotransferase RimO [Erythrobacter sp.]
RYTTSHPADMDDDLIAAHGDTPKLMPFLHLPVQAGSDRVLKAMNRSHSVASYLELLDRFRAARPDLALSGDFIVGFPGETEEDFQYLLDWLDEAQLDRVGAFTYSPVEGARANEIEGAVPEEVKEERLARFMAKQAEISAARLQAKIGTTIEVLIDEVDDEGAIGRSKADAPEIDGMVYLNGETDLQPGQIVRAVVENADEHDLWAELA